jgi:hypothetical protein
MRSSKASKMSHIDIAHNALNSLKDQIAKEKDPQRLRELISEINVLLDLIEKQVEKLEDGISGIIN